MVLVDYLNILNFMPQVTNDENFLKYMGYSFNPNEFKLEESNLNKSVIWKI